MILNAKWSLNENGGSIHCHLNLLLCLKLECQEWHTNRCQTNLKHSLSHSVQEKKESIIIESPDGTKSTQCEKQIPSISLQVLQKAELEGRKKHWSAPQRVQIKCTKLHKRPQIERRGEICIMECNERPL